MPLKMKFVAAIVLTMFCVPCQAEITTTVDQSQLETSEKEWMNQARLVLDTEGVAPARATLKRQFDQAQNQPHYDILLARLLSQANRKAEAGKVLEDLARSDSDRLDVRMVFAELAIQQGRWFDGWNHLLAAERANPPTNWDAAHAATVRREQNLLKARCCEGRRDWSAAANLYVELAESSDSDDPILSGRLHTAIARCEFYQDRLQEAGDHFSIAFQEDPRLDSPSLALARLCDQAGKQDEAHQYFLKAVTVEDEQGRTRAQLAFARWCLWHNLSEEVTEILDSEYSEPANEIERQLQLAMAARMQRKFTNARSTLTALHQANPGVFAIGNQLALVLIESSDEALRSRALQVAEANVRNNPKLAEAWATLGWVQFRLGDLASAQRNLSQAMSGGNISRDVAWYLAQVHQRLGNMKKANELLAAAESAKGPFFAASQPSSQQ